MKRRALSFLLAFCMMISLLSGAAMAADPVITLTGGDLLRGNTLVVPVTIADNPTIGSANIHVVYDETALKLETIQGLYEDPVAGMQMGMVSLEGNPAANAIAYAEATGISSDGGLFWLTFSVVETAANGDYSVTLEKLPNTSAMFIGTDGSHLNIAIEPATITVTDVVKKPAALIGDQEYDTIGEAIEAANAAKVETVVTLNDDVKNPIAVLDLGPKATLDLNGHTLQVSSIGAVEGFIVDSTGSGLLKYEGGNNFLVENNPQIPIWDEAEGGYRLAGVSHRQGNDKWTEGESSFTYTFRFDLDKQDWNDLLLSNQKTTANGLAITAGVDVYVNGEELIENGIEINDEDCTEEETYIHRIIENARGGYRFKLINAKNEDKVVIRSWIRIGGVKHVSGARIYTTTTYEDYLDKSFAEKKAFRDTFPSAALFSEWLNQARTEYEAANRPSQVGPDGVIDLEKP